MMKADLHVHSTFSDGSQSPGECVLAAARAGLDIISITDHDTSAHVATAIEAGQRYGVKVLAGVEISAVDPQSACKVHILGYGFKKDAAAIEGLCAPLREARHKKSLRCVEILSSLNYPISVDAVLKRARAPAVVYKQHIMDYLTSVGSADGVTGLTYRQLFKNGGPCAADIFYPDCRDAVAAIKMDGGLAFLAHPGQIGSLEQALAITKELLDYGLDGVELNHQDNDAQMRAALMALSSEKGILFSGGSDAHGDFGNEGEIGALLCPDGAVETLLARLNGNVI